MLRFDVGARRLPAWDRSRNLVLVFLAVGSGFRCGPVVAPPDDISDEDPVPVTAEYLGAATCRACHPALGELHRVHGHSEALKETQDAAPTYPPEGTLAGVTTPPSGFEWQDLAFVIGGYTKAANFVDREGFLLTDGEVGEPIQYLLRHGPSRSEPAYTPLSSDAADTAPLTYACFRCHTTGPESLAANGGRRQGGRDGIEGTWAEAGVQCEACHGPGSRHVSDPSDGNVLVGSARNSCEGCHAGNSGSDGFTVTGGFLDGNQQVQEVAASPHAGFACTVCHDPHASVLYDPENGLRNGCRSCHASTGMALHEGRIFVLGDDVERLSCQSCHMPLASRNARSVLAPLAGPPDARIGDTRTHIIEIDTAPHDFTSMFHTDGSTVATDARGQAAVTLDFVCLRCHSGLGNAFELALPAAAAIADGMHRQP